MAVEIPLTDLIVGKPTAVQHEGQEILVVRLEDGGVTAYENACPHAYWPLDGGWMEGEVLMCPGHAWEFNIRTGECLTIPTCGLNAYPVEVEGDTVRVFPTGATS